MPADSRLLSPVFDNRPLSRRETACRSCGSQSLHPVIDLGEAPLADRLLSSEWDCRAEPRFPLAAVLCLECSLVQLTETVRPEVLFADDYPYYSSVSRTVLGHARANVEARLKERALGRSSLVVEIGSNDGYLLKNYVAAGVTVPSTFDMWCSSTTTRHSAQRSTPARRRSSASGSSPPLCRPPSAARPSSSSWCA